LIEARTAKNAERLFPASEGRLDCGCCESPHGQGPRPAPKLIAGDGGCRGIDVRFGRPAKIGGPTVVRSSSIQRTTFEKPFPPH